MLYNIYSISDEDIMLSDWAHCMSLYWLPYWFSGQSGPERDNTEKLVKFFS